MPHYQRKWIHFSRQQDNYIWQNSPPNAYCDLVNWARTSSLYIRPPSNFFVNYSDFQNLGSKTNVLARISTANFDCQIPRVGREERQTTDTWPSSTEVRNPDLHDKIECLPLYWFLFKRCLFTHTTLYSGNKDAEPFSNQSSKDGKTLGTYHRTNCRPCRRRDSKGRHCVAFVSGVAIPRRIHGTKIHIFALP